MSFHQQSWAARSGSLGDEAEQICDTIYPQHHKLGLNRPPFQVNGVKAEMRYTPDRMLRDRFVEVQGIGSDRTLKLKIEKVRALFAWENIGPVWLFVWDRKAVTYHEAPIGVWFEAMVTLGKTGVFDESKTYLSLTVPNFPCPAIPFKTGLDT